MSIYDHFSEEEVEILRARAARAARITEKRESQETLITVLQFTLGSEAYALPVDCLLAVYENLTIIPVPGTPPHIAGIANIRGRITPVLDLAVLLNVPRAKEDTISSLAVISRKEINLALRLDTVGEITSFSDGNIGPLPAGGDTLERAAYLRGITADGFTLLNVDMLFSDPTLIVDDVAS